MRSRFGVYLPALAAACALPAATSALAGAGLRSSGDTLYSTRLGVITANQAWDEQSTLQDSDCRSVYTSQSNALEHGYTYYNTFYGQFSLARSQCGGEATTGFSDLRVGVRSRLNVYENDGAWELEATIPVSDVNHGERRIGCGEFGLAANVHQRVEVTPSTDLDGSASVQLWGAPLAHQFRASVGIDQKFLRRWSWSGGVHGSVPLNDGIGGIGDLTSDCGTESKIVRGAADLKYRWSDFLHLGCGVSHALWGESASRTQGMSCGFSYLWKD